MSNTAPNHGHAPRRHGRNNDVTTNDRTWIGVRNLIVNSLNPSAATDYITDRYILIDRDELPEATYAGDGFVGCDVEVDGQVYGIRSDTTPEFHRRNALRHLALAEYLEAIPTVDEAQVDALADLLHTTSAIYDRELATNIARRLVRAGVHVEVDQ